MNNDGLTCFSTGLGKKEIHERSHTKISTVVGDKTDKLFSAFTFMPTKNHVKSLVFDLQMCSAAPFSQSMSCLPYGLPQCRLLVGGAQRIAGVNLASVPGFSIGAKIAYISSLSKPDVQSLVEKSGFVYYKPNAGAVEVAVIPSNYLVLTECPSELKVSGCISC